MSDCIDFAAMLTEVGGWDTPLPFFGEQPDAHCTEPTLDDQFGYMPTNITSNVFRRIEEGIGSEHNKTPESKDQLSEDNRQILREAFRKIQFDITSPQTNQDSSAVDDHKHNVNVSDTNIKLPDLKLDQDSEPFNSEIKVSISTSDQDLINQEKVVQEPAQQKGFFNKWVIGGVVVVMAAVLGTVAYIKKL